MCNRLNKFFMRVGPPVFLTLSIFLHCGIGFASSPLQEFRGPEFRCLDIFSIETKIEHLTAKLVELDDRTKAGAQISTADVVLLDYYLETTGGLSHIAARVVHRVARDTNSQLDEFLIFLGILESHKFTYSDEPVAKSLNISQIYRSYLLDPLKSELAYDNAKVFVDRFWDEIKFDSKGNKRFQFVRSTMWAAQDYYERLWELQKEDPKRFAKTIGRELINRISGGDLRSISNFLSQKSALIASDSQGFKMATNLDLPELDVLAILRSVAPLLPEMVSQFDGVHIANLAKIYTFGFSEDEIEDTLRHHEILDRNGSVRRLLIEYRLLSLLMAKNAIPRNIGNTIIHSNSWHRDLPATIQKVLGLIEQEQD